MVCENPVPYYVPLVQNKGWCLWRHDQSLHRNLHRFVPHCSQKRFFWCPAVVYSPICRSCGPRSFPFLHAPTANLNVVVIIYMFSHDFIVPFSRKTIRTTYILLMCHPCRPGPVLSFIRRCTSILNKRNGLIDDANALQNVLWSPSRPLMSLQFTHCYRHVISARFVQLHSTQTA